VITWDSSPLAQNDNHEVAIAVSNNGGVKVEFSDYLAEEWVLALGCTEPASIALAAATAASQHFGNLESVDLIVDTRIYKNCYAVGIPHSGHMTGIKWAVAIGANITEPNMGLECFRLINDDVLNRAKMLIAENRIHVEVDASKDDLYIDCRLRGSEGESRAVIANDHTNIIFLGKNGHIIKQKASEEKGSRKKKIRQEIALMSLQETIEMARSITPNDRERLMEGITLNRRIAEHGLSLFPKKFVNSMTHDSLTMMSTLVCAGVYARMWGEDLPVMSLAGSGNKGIVVSVPLSMHGERLGHPVKCVEEALALACLVTSATTYHLGTLSAVCGCSNAAGIGLATGLVYMEGGGTKEISLAINNMVGNVTGMICDGAKIGCALKTMTAVDSAFRATSLAMSGIGIPPSDGIIGSSGNLSLENLGRIATYGMESADKEILAIMQEKLKSL
jgi:L-cysteine desulfidase